MKVDSDASSISFVYPFLFNPTNFDQHVEITEQVTWSGRKGSLKVWVQQPFPGEDLLSHVARFLNPSAELQPTATLWTVSNDALQSIAGGLGSGKTSNVEWTLIAPPGQIHFRLCSVQLVLFRTGVGFVTFCVTPGSPTGQVNEWLDLVHYFRFFRGQRHVQISAERCVRFDKESSQSELVPFFPEPAGGIHEHPDGKGVLDDLVCAVLQSAGVQSEPQRWWRDVFIPGQLLPFVILYVDDASSDEIPFLLYRVRNFFHSQEEIHPAQEHLRTDHESLLPYAEQQWFVFSLDGGGFVACNAPETDFYRRVAPDHMRKQYFLLFMLTLQQRFAFMMLLDQVAESWPVEESNADNYLACEARENAFQYIRNQLLSFVARGYFAQAMQQEHHHRCYRKWQETFQVERLYQEVSNEIRYMHDHLQSQRDRQMHRLEEEKRRRDERLEKTLNTIAWLIGGPALALTFVDVANSTGDIALTARAVVIGLLIGLLLITVLSRVFSRGHRKS